MKINKVGAIIVSAADTGKILLLYRGQDKDWSFPKGHVEVDENILQAMNREVLEETGLALRSLRQLPNMEYKNSRGEDIKVSMFFGVSVDDAMLRVEFEGDQLMWKNIGEVDGLLSYQNLKDYFKLVRESLVE